MTDYIGIVETETNPGAPSKSSLWKRWSKNWIAGFEGAPGAPRLMDAALDTTAPSLAGANWVGARNIVAAVGAIGSFAFLSNQSLTAALLAPGTVVAGSGLRYSAAGQIQNTPTPTGSWRSLGYHLTDSLANQPATSGARATLWLRIS